ncbi:MAG TPA: HAD-IA family hydrolase [Thermoleophilaceae bacterium]|nr:HAD-IA family hydrolase [Thermoleophilaceae bacterium]
MGIGTRAVLLDMFDTLVELEPPAPRLRTRLHEKTGIDVGEEAAARGFAAEIGHYLANHMQGSDAPALEALRDDCARVLHDALGQRDLERAAVRQAMLEALELRVFPDAPPALRGLRGQGVRLVVVSNWDCSLPEWLERTGLAELVDGVVSSAVVGSAKPSREIFRAALDVAGAGPGEALHVGDSLASDVAGARAAGLRAVLIARGGDAPEGVEAIRSLEELLSLI